MAPNVSGQHTTWGIDPDYIIGTASRLLLVLAAFADDVGDVVVALFLLLDERRLFGLLDLDIVVSGGRGFALLALGLGVGVLQRDEFGVRRLR